MSFRSGHVFDATQRLVLELPGIPVRSHLEKSVCASESARERGAFLFVPVLPPADALPLAGDSLDPEDPRVARVLPLHSGQVGVQPGYPCVDLHSIPGGQRLRCAAHLAFAGAHLGVGQASLLEP